ncbi:hypothetical protein [Ponticaulis sp.]|uniref:hypothetical protein n=1 Tax=Ponticaulis sp. TaxID=2020902 RepID=UPI000B6B88CF|nr:hypothetical protein [Ponticaulis sp.]MAI90821.1 hypothetical protein [Ponticaulis sp.]OUX98796.1 MAG: hypothetical protein CBB65_10295 [Hyphomonadaceae bacterium TMED5]
MTDIQTGAQRAKDMFGRPNRFIKRNKLACIICSIFAVLAISLSALIILFIANIIATLVGWDLSSPFSDSVGMNSEPMAEAFSIALIACGLNFFVAPISVPVTWIVLSQTTGRLAHRGVNKARRYILATVLTGAIITSATCTILQVLSNPNLSTNDLLLGMTVAFFSAWVIGSLAGLMTGAIFVAIVRPKAQLAAQSVQISDVF